MPAMPHNTTLKLALTVVAMLLIGASLLAMRQQRLELGHAVYNAHMDIDRNRRQQWDLQTRIAEHIEPEQIRTRLDEQGLTMEPTVVPAPPADDVDPWSHSGQVVSR